MLWIIQDNLYSEYGYENFIKELTRQNHNYIVVKPVPFTNRFVASDFDSMVDDFETAEEPYIDDSQPIMVCGSTTLTRIASKRGWTPGSFINANFDFSIWSKGFNLANILNDDAKVSTVKDAIFDFDSEAFLRPIDDSKAFAGMVQTRKEFLKWQASISKIEKEDEFTSLHKDTEIMISSAKHIKAEYRFFIVDGKVITGSLYKRGSRVIHDTAIDDYIVNFAQKMVDQWQPAQAFVLDVADTNQGLKVIEINNINSAGFYASDVQKFINSIENMVL